ncbi:hypothetical protein A4S06_03490 [Erysipelotrichaceae bacterium MTC7]|nr:hypothetical protein A4S06_03490 [Erysipelotrichaceae bacterium MTC7]
MNSFDITPYLQEALDYAPDGIVKEAAYYSLLNGGKHVRSKILFATLDAYHMPLNKGIEAAIAIEMIHTYSLIHDDLPSMDNDTLRRGKPTCHVKYGEDIAILAGDTLLTEAFRYVAKSCERGNTKLVVEQFVDAAGIKGMIYGQQLDISNENKSIDIDELKEINHYKTAKLITLPMIIGSIIADKYSGDKECWEQIGYKLGLAFQIQDDILDVTASTDVLGKDTNSDERNQKTTYVSLLGLEKSKEIVETLLNDIEGLLDTLIIDKRAMMELIEELRNRKN